MKLSSSEQRPNRTELRRGAEAYKEAFGRISMIDYEISKWEKLNPLGFLYDPITEKIETPPFHTEEGGEAFREVLLSRRKDLEVQVKYALEVMLQSGSLSDVAEELCREKE